MTHNVMQGLQYRAQRVMPVMPLPQLNVASQLYCRKHQAHVPTIASNRNKVQKRPSSHTKHFLALTSMCTSSSNCSNALKELD